MRTCGDCTECCTAIGVEDLQKGPGERCKHQCSTGCAIYTTKPKDCTDYKCWYLQAPEHLGPDMRPDRCGVIIDTMVHSNGTEICCVRELWPGASEKNNYIKQLILKIANLQVVYVMQAGKNPRRMLGPPELLQPILNEAEKRHKGKLPWKSQIIRGLPGLPQ